MRRRPIPLFAFCLAVSAFAIPGAGCSATNDKGGGTLTEKDSGTASGDDGSTTGDDVGALDDSGGLIVSEIGTNPTDAPSSGCKATDDCDGDGYKTAQDCNDLDGTINPEAYDFPGDMLDNDCDGVVDNPVVNCAGTSTTATDPVNYARTLDLCPQNSVTSTGKKFDPVVSATWGKVSSTFGTINTSMKQVGRQAKFGNNAARNGADLVALSTGTLNAKDPRDPVQGGINTASVTAPCAAIGINAADAKSLTAGTTGGSCATLSANDYAELKIAVKVPSNANAMLFDFSFFSTEFNEFWKSNYNDGFFVLVTSKNLAGINVAKDSAGLGITVNSGYFQLCPALPGPTGLSMGKVGGLKNCVGQPTDPTAKILGSLTGTGFAGELLATPSTDDTTKGFVDTAGKYVYGGSSGWLSSKFGVTPGEQLVIRFIIFDTGDNVLDSAVILDNVRWEKAPPTTVDPVVERPPS
jgi:hypothetical protein